MSSRYNSNQGSGNSSNRVVSDSNTSSSLSKKSTMMNNQQTQKKQGRNQSHEYEEEEEDEEDEDEEEEDEDEDEEDEEEEDEDEDEEESEDEEEEDLVEEKKNNIKAKKASKDGIDCRKASHNFRAHSGVYTANIEGQEIDLSQCKGNKKGLLVGINYIGTNGQLRGCHNDVDNVKGLLQSKFGFKEENIMVMKDDHELPKECQPTRENMIAGLHLLVEGAKAGDSLFFHFSGHGGNQEDLDGDEDDGMDETICPVDYAENGMIVDDELFEILVKNLPKGVRLTALFDSCHSGTALDLPFSYKSDGSLLVKERVNIHSLMIGNLNEAVGSLLQGGDHDTATEMIMKSLQDLKVNQGKTPAELASEKKNVAADVIMFSGCYDSQTSSDAIIDAAATGAISHALVKVLSQQSNLTCLELLNKIRLELEGNFEQFPQISTGYPMDLNTPFYM